MKQLLDNPVYGGYSSGNGTYNYVGGYSSCFWSSTVYSDTNAWYRLLSYRNSDVSHYYYTKRYGFSLRCVRGL